MNDKFYSLEKEKQRRIIDAGFRIFSLSSYKKTPVSEIAEEASISKSLLFHYFHNKKELYLFLWDQAAHLSEKFLYKDNCLQRGNLFDIMEKGLEIKLNMIEKYPHMAAFAIRAFYEKDSEIRSAIQSRLKNLSLRQEEQLIASLRPEDYRPGLDLSRMYRHIYWTAEGYLWEKVHQGDMDPLELRDDFYDMLVFWRSIYENPAKKDAGDQREESK